MVYSGESIEKPNGTVLANGQIEGEEATPPQPQEDDYVTLPTVLNRLAGDIFRPDPSSKEHSLPERIRASVSENAPLLRPALKNTGGRALAWVRQGSPLRALLAVSVGTISLITVTGLLVFTLFFVTATINTVVISLVVSLAAAGGFLALFFAFAAAVYIGALAVAVFVISTVTAFSIGLVLIAAGWVGFFVALWLAVRKSLEVAKRSISMTGSAIRARSSARHRDESKML